jgi:uroporphyrinogen decarboxylase
LKATITKINKEIMTMTPMTSYERYKRMYQHREADRIPIIDSPWEGTVVRWHKEGLPKSVDWSDYFGIDKVAGVYADNSPRFPSYIVEETDTYIINHSSWGVTTKQLKGLDTTPEFLGFTVTTPDSWRATKAQMTPTSDRIDWKYLEQNYKSWRENGIWVMGCLWFGFDITHSWFVGTENLLMALAEEPEWCYEMFMHELDMCIDLMNQVLDRGYVLDEVMWPDDMGYKLNQFFSMKTYRDILKPVQKKAIKWAHSKGIYTHLHSCGDIRPFVPELIEIGIDCLNPMEVKAGMDPYTLKKEFGDKLVLHGGLNAVLWDNIDECEAEMRRLIPVVKENGGYIFSSDHSIPNTVSFESMKRIIALAKELGTY